VRRRIRTNVVVIVVGRSVDVDVVEEVQIGGGSSHGSQGQVGRLAGRLHNESVFLLLVTHKTPIDGKSTVAIAIAAATATTPYKSSSCESSFADGSLLWFRRRRVRR